MTISLPSVLSNDTTSARVASTDASVTPSSVSANKLIDTANSFSNVAVGDYVVLQDNPKVFTTVTALDSATELSLDDDIITSTSDYYFVLTAATAFKIVRDNSGAENYNYQVLVSPGDLVDSSDTQDVDQTLSGCRVVSVDGVGQLTVDLPMGGYTSVEVSMQKFPNALDLSNIDVFYNDADNEEVVAATVAGDIDSYVSLYGYGLDAAASRAIILSDLEEAIVDSVGGGWKTNIPVNQRATGAQEWDI